MMGLSVELSELSDRELIDACLRGEQRGWTQLVSKYERLIYSVARALCPRPDDCADVFQQVCIALYENLKKLRSDQTIPAWLITVTRRHAYALIRTKEPQANIDDYEAVSQGQIDIIEREFEIDLALGQLPERCRNLVNLLYFDTAEPSYAEIAEKMGMPVASIGPTRARCLEKLKKLLTPTQDQTPIQ
jgi:RNA polymerase sigma factor (sigma-70 family)